MKRKETAARARWRMAYRNARAGNLRTCASRYPDIFGVLYDAHWDRRVCRFDRHALNGLRSFDRLWGVLRARVIGGRDSAVGDDKRFNRWRGVRARVTGC